MQDPTKLRVYNEAFNLTIDVFRRFRGINVSQRLREQLFGAVSSVGANLAELGAFESKPQQKQKILVCIGECNEGVYWFNVCKETGVLMPSEADAFIERIIRIRVMLFNLLQSVKEELR